jgi:Protein of unknown function (DUF3822)
VIPRLPSAKVGKPTIFKLLTNIARNQSQPLKKLFQISSADTKENVEPVLCLRVGEKHCSYAIVDKSSQSLKSLVYYKAENINDSRLNALAATHPELNRSFDHVFVCYDYPEYTLISDEEERVNDPRQLLRAICQANESSIIFSEPVHQLAMQNEYCVPGSVHEWMKNKFRGARYYHQYSLMMKCMGNEEGESRLILDFRTDEFVLLATRNGAFQLAQTFSYTTPDDVLYYLLKTCNQFSLSQQDVRVQLSGLIDKQSVLYTGLYQYFIHIEFRKAKWLSPQDQYPAHFFTSLNDLSQCE